MKPSSAFAVAVSGALKGSARLDVMVGVRMTRRALDVMRVRRKAWTVAMGVVRLVESASDHVCAVRASIGLVEDDRFGMSMRPLNVSVVVLG